mgnify:CR=1 FL=1
MYKYNFLLLMAGWLFLWSCAGSNATTMEYRSATTAVRSERDLKKGEEYALKALDMEMHANDARVAYFLAIEIYKPRRNWEEMNRMLDIAITRNPEQSLERPFRLDDGSIVKTIADAVPIYKDQIWMNAFNQTVELVDAEKFDEAIKKISFAKTVLKKVDNYTTSCLLNIQIDNRDAAKEDLKMALILEPNNYRVLQIAGDLAQEDGNLVQAKEYYEKALVNTEDKNELIQSLVYINVELEDYEKAISLSDDLLANNPDDPDVYFNVGVIYQRLGSDFYDSAVEEYKGLINQEKPSASSIQSAYSLCIKSLDMVKLALNYFMDSSMLEVEDNPETDTAMAEMKRIRKNIKDIYILSIEQIAANNKVNLD